MQTVEPRGMWDTFRQVGSMIVRLKCCVSDKCEDVCIQKCLVKLLFILSCILCSRDLPGVSSPITSTTTKVQPSSLPPCFRRFSAWSLIFSKWDISSVELTPSGWLGEQRAFHCLAWSRLQLRFQFAQYEVWNYVKKELKNSCAFNPIYSRNKQKRSELTISTSAFVAI